MHENLRISNVNKEASTVNGCHVTWDLQDLKNTSRERKQFKEMRKYSFLQKWGEEEACY